MTECLQIFIELLDAIVWPVVAVVALFVFRKPLTGFVEEIGKRATKFSVFDVAIEFTTMPNPPQVPWSDPAFSEGTNLICGNVTSTTIMELFQRIRDDTHWQYLIVNIGSGKRWLISRLFLFATIFRYMSGLKCVVFVETTNEYHKRLLGIADPDRLRAVLAKKYPWLDHALMGAWLKQDIPILAEPLSKQNAELIVNNFIENDLIRRSEDPQNDDEWEKLGEQPSCVWEHTKWLNIGRLNEDLREAFFDTDSSQFKWSPDIPTKVRDKAVLLRDSPFVALVNDRGEFKELMDRGLLIDRLAKHVAEQSDER